MNLRENDTLPALREGVRAVAQVCGGGCSGRAGSQVREETLCSITMEPGESHVGEPEPLPWVLECGEEAGSSEARQGRAEGEGRAGLEARAVPEALVQCLSLSLSLFPDIVTAPVHVPAEVKMS